MTARDVINAALRRLNIISASETAAAEDATYGLETLNELIDNWKLSGLNSFVEGRTTCNLVSGQADYEVGLTTLTGFITSRPISPQIIDRINYIDTAINPTNEIPLNSLTIDAYSIIPIKTQASPYPTCYYYNPTFPLGTVTFWPVPNISTVRAVLYSITQIEELATLSTTFSMPPGYRLMYVTNLAKAMAPAYEKAQIPPDLMQSAADSLADVRRANFRLADMNIDPAALGSRTPWAGLYNIFSDTNA